MTVEEAIEELKGLAISTISSKRERALSIAISALGKEKEPAPQEAETSSSKNNFINNDNTRLKICQDVIDKQIEDRVDYYNNQLSNDEQAVFNEGQRYRELVFVKKTLEEEINETEKDH